MDWRGHSGSRGTNLMASAGILREGVAGQITVTETGMWVDSTMTRDVELPGAGNCLWRRKERCLNDALGGCWSHSLT